MKKYCAHQEPLLSGFCPDCETFTGGPLNRAFRKSASPPRDSAATVRALALIERGWTAYRAARHVGIALSTIYRAVARQRARQEKRRDL